MPRPTVPALTASTGHTTAVERVTERLTVSPTHPQALIGAPTSAFPQPTFAPPAAALIRRARLLAVRTWLAHRGETP